MDTNERAAQPSPLAKQEVTTPRNQKVNSAKYTSQSPLITTTVLSQQLSSSGSQHEAPASSSSVKQSPPQLTKCSESPEEPAALPPPPPATTSRSRGPARAETAAAESTEMRLASSSGIAPEEGAAATETSVVVPCPFEETTQCSPSEDASLNAQPKKKKKNKKKKKKTSTAGDTMDAAAGAASGMTLGEPMDESARPLADTRTYGPPMPPHQQGGPASSPRFYPPHGNNWDASYGSRGPVPGQGPYAPPFHHHHHQHHHQHQPALPQQPYVYGASRGGERPGMGPGPYAGGGGGGGYYSMADPMMSQPGMMGNAHASHYTQHGYGMGAGGYGYANGYYPPGVGLSADGQTLGPPLTGPASSSPPGAYAGKAHRSAPAASGTNTNASTSNNNNSASRAGRQAATATAAGGTAANAAVLGHAQTASAGGDGGSRNGSAHRSASSSFTGVPAQAQVQATNMSVQPYEGQPQSQPSSQGNTSGPPYLHHHHHHQHQQHQQSQHAQQHYGMHPYPVPQGAVQDPHLYAMHAGMNGYGMGAMVGPHGAAMSGATRAPTYPSQSGLDGGQQSYDPYVHNNNNNYNNSNAYASGPSAQGQTYRQSGGGANGGQSRAAQTQSGSPPPPAPPLSSSHAPPPQPTRDQYSAGQDMPWGGGPAAYGWGAHSDPYATTMMIGTSEEASAAAGRDAHGYNPHQTHVPNGRELAMSSSAELEQPSATGHYRASTPPVASSSSAQGRPNGQRQGFEQSASGVGYARQGGAARTAPTRASAATASGVGQTSTVGHLANGGVGAGGAGSHSQSYSHSQRFSPRTRVPRGRWFTPEVSQRLSELVDREVLHYLMPSVVGLVRRRHQLECLAAHITDAIYDAGALNKHAYGQVRFYIFGSVNMRTVLPDGDNDLTVLVDGLLPSEKDTVPITAASLHPVAPSCGVTTTTTTPPLVVMPSTTDSNSGNKEGTLHMATLADGRPVLAPPAAIGIAAGQLLSNVRDYLHSHDTPIYVDALVSAEVRVLKLAMEGSSYDITVSQFGGVNCVRFLHEMDAAVGGEHLLKRTLLLLKSWCCYEAHILGGQGGYIGSYAATVMLIAMLNTVEFIEDIPTRAESTTEKEDGEDHANEAPTAEQASPDASPPLFSPQETAAGSLLSPLRLVARFLKFYRFFDFDNYCVTAFGPLPLTAISAVAFDLSKLEVSAALATDDASRDGATDITGTNKAGARTTVLATPSNPESGSHEEEEATVQDVDAINTTPDAQGSLTAEQVVAQALAAICRTPAHSRPVRRNAYGVDVNFLGLTAEGEKAIGHLVRRREKPLLTVSGVKHLLHEMNQSRQEDRLRAYDRRQDWLHTHQMTPNTRTDEDGGQTPSADGAAAGAEKKGTDRANAAPLDSNPTSPTTLSAPLKHTTTQTFTSPTSPFIEPPTRASPSNVASAQHRFVGLNRAGRVEEDTTLLCPSCNTCSFPVRSMNVLDPLRWSSNMVRGVSRNHLQRIVRALEEGLRRFAVASQELAAGEEEGHSPDCDGQVSSRGTHAECQQEEEEAAAAARREPLPPRTRAENDSASASVPASVESMGTPLGDLSPDDQPHPGYPAPRSNCTQREVNVLRFTFESTINAIQRNSAVNCPWDVPMQGSHPDLQEGHEPAQTVLEVGAEEGLAGEATTIATNGSLAQTGTAAERGEWDPSDAPGASGTNSSLSSSLLHPCPQCQRASIFCTPDIPVMCQPQVTFDSPGLASQITQEVFAWRRRQGPLGEQLLPSDSQMMAVGLSGFVDDGSGGAPMPGYGFMDPGLFAAQAYPLMAYGGEMYGGGGGAGGVHQSPTHAFPGWPGEPVMTMMTPYGPVPPAPAHHAGQYAGRFGREHNNGNGNSGARMGMGPEGEMMMGYGNETGRQQQQQQQQQQHQQRARGGNMGAIYGAYPAQEMPHPQYMPSPVHYANSNNNNNGGGAQMNKNTSHEFHHRAMSGMSGYLSDGGSTSGGARRSGGGSASNANANGSNNNNNGTVRRQSSGGNSQAQPQQPLAVTVGRRAAGPQPYGDANMPPSSAPTGGLA